MRRWCFISRYCPTDTRSGPDCWAPPTVCWPPGRARESSPRPSTDRLLVMRGGEELPQAVRFRIGEDRLRVALFFDAALMQEDHVVGDFAGEAHLVGHHQHS